MGALRGEQEKGCVGSKRLPMVSLRRRASGSKSLHIIGEVTFRAWASPWHPAFSIGTWST